MLPVLLLAFIAVPIAELAIIIGIGGRIGLGPTVGLLVLSAVAGTALVRWQGRAAWHALVSAVRAGRPPAREVLDGAMVLVGGALLLTPGFLTDLLGLSLVVPVTRAAIRSLLARRLVARMAAQMSRAGPTRGNRPRPAAGGDVEGTARDVDRPADVPEARR